MLLGCERSEPCEHLLLASPVDCGDGGVDGEMGGFVDRDAADDDGAIDLG